MERLKVNKSRNGVGIFATTNFLNQEVIFEVKGKIISCNEEDELDDIVRDNTFRFDEYYYISPEGELGDFLNHSCEPNSAVMKKDNKLFIKVISRIEKNTEILIDYSTIIAADDVWEMKCNCGSSLCRKVIKRFNTLPSTIQKRYLSLQMVPSYILEL